MKPYIVNMNKEQAKKTYQGRVFSYRLSDSHLVSVIVTHVRVYGGVVLCRVRPLNVITHWIPDKTNYKELTKDYILAGRLGA